jgi:hypothetical protein
VRHEGIAINKAIWIALVALGFATGLAVPVPAQEWPQKPIRIIVAFAAGGGADIVSRILALSMQEKFGQSIVVENRRSISRARAEASHRGPVPARPLLLVFLC